MRLWIVFCGLLLATASFVHAELNAQSSTDQILDALDQRGQGLTGFIANVKLTDTDAALGEATSRLGKVWYQAGDAQRIRVTFDKKEANGKIAEDKVEYLLAGPDLIDRTYRTSTQVTRHVLKPGEKMNLLKLGEGPFPLPIGQKKEDVYAMFDVKKVDSKKDDPAETVRIQLIPKADTRFEKRFKNIDVCIGMKDSMPRRIETMDKNETSIRTTDLGEVQVNPTMNDADFALPKIDESKWHLHEEAFTG